MEDEQRLPNRIAQIGAGFFLLFLFVTVLLPQQTYVEFAARWQLLLALVAGMLVGAGVWGKWPLHRAFVPIAVFGWLVASGASFKFGGLIGVEFPFPFAGHDFLSVVLTGAFGVLIVGTLAAWAAKNGPEGTALFAAWACGAAAALLGFLLLDGLHQYFYRYPAAIAELEMSGPLGPVEVLILESMSNGRISGRWGNANVFAAVILILWPLAAGLWSTLRIAWLRWMMAALLFGLAPGVLWSTGSRGGLLCALILGALFFVAATIQRKRQGISLLPVKTRWMEVAASVVLAAFLVFAIRSDPPAGKPANTTNQEAAASRFARPSTITMRIGFLQAGWRMITQPAPQAALDAAPLNMTVTGIASAPPVEIKIDPAPIATPNLLIGNGAGSYEHLSLLFQTPGRQESKYAHNWALQYLIELGIVGLLAPIALLIFASLFWFAGLKTPDEERAPAAENLNADAPYDAAQLIRILPTVALLSTAIFWINGGLEITPYLSEPFLIGAAAITIAFCFGRQPRLLNNIVFKIAGLAVILFIGFIYVQHAPVQAAMSRTEKLRQGPLEYLRSVADQTINPQAFTIQDFERAARDIENTYLELKEKPALAASPEPYLLYADMHETVARVTFTDPTEHLYYARAALAEAAKRSPYSASISARWGRAEPDLQKREILLRRAIGLHPADPQYRAELARMLFSQNQKAPTNDLAKWADALAEALELLDQAIAREYRSDAIEAHEALKRQIKAQR